MISFIAGCNLVTLSEQLATPLMLYSDCFRRIMCQEQTFQCYFYNCDKCPGIQTLKNLVLDILDENKIDEITYKYWISKPRTSLETFVKNSTVAVHEFTRITTSFITELSNDAAKVIYFSDGAPQQFKNYKNFVNLNYHKKDFGETVKRMAARASLQLSYDEQISTPQQLYEWAVRPNCLPNIRAQFFSNDEYIRAKESLEKRYTRAKTITRDTKIPLCNSGRKRHFEILGVFVVFRIANVQNIQTCKKLNTTK